MTPAFQMAFSHLESQRWNLFRRIRRIQRLPRYPAVMEHSRQDAAPTVMPSRQLPLFMGQQRPRLI